jgi:hypothetical protein
MSKNSSNLLGFAALFQSLNPFPSYIHLRFRPSAVRSGCKGMKFIFQNANVFLKTFLLWIFENALSLRDYKGTARIIISKPTSNKKSTEKANDYTDH